MRPGEILTAIWTGFIATLIMTVVMYALPLVGMPAMDVMATLGAVFPYNLSPYILGASAHFAIGIILAVIYAAFFYFLLPGPRLIRGMLFSFLPWLFAITLMAPTLKVATEILRGSPASGRPNPCAPVNPCAPAAAQPTANPCGAPVQPCAPTSQPRTPTSQPPAPVVQPCVPTGPTPGGIPPQVLSLIVHLIYGVVLGVRYRP